jgi:hypothetical protein
MPFVSAELLVEFLGGMALWLALFIPGRGTDRD